jgi:hypothetical protein
MNWTRLSEEFWSERKAGPKVRQFSEELIRGVEGCRAEDLDIRLQSTPTTGISNAWAPSTGT